MISNWALYYMKKSDYAQHKMEVNKLYSEVLRIAKMEEEPREWSHYMDLLGDIQELEDKCSLLLDEIHSFNFRK